MTSIITKHNCIKAIQIDGTVKSGSTITILTATVPDGWNFLTWVHATSKGWVGLVYPSNLIMQETTFFVETASSSSREFRATYLIYR